MIAAAAAVVIIFAVRVLIAVATVPEEAATDYGRFSERLCSRSQRRARFRLNA